MAKPRNNATGGLPRWLIVAGSVAIFLHLSAVVALALSAPSGPWPTPFGSSMATGPQFALGFSDAATRHYLPALKWPQNYHFLRSRPAPPGAFFEVRLKDKTGKPMKTLRFPEENANFWVRHRQELLARALADDQPVQARPGEVLAAPHQQV